MAKLPVFAYREVIGHASSKAQAIRVIRNSQTIHPKAKLHCNLRSPIMQDLLQLPAGYVFSVSFG